jgi:hypothetical protein
MADITLTSNESYRFGRFTPYGGGTTFTMVTDGTDKAQTPEYHIRTGVTINCPANSQVASLKLINLNNSTAQNSILTLEVGGSSAGDPYIRYTTNDANGNWAIGVDNSDTNAFIIANSSTLGSTTVEALKIDISEEVYLRNISAGAGTYALKWTTTTGQLTYDTSTAKTKKNITNALTSSYNDILKLQPREFNYKKTTDNNTYLGLIAEEVAEVNPIFAIYGPDIEWDENGKHSQSNSNDIVPVNINDRALITALIGKIQNLESRLSILENSK